MQLIPTLEVATTLAGRETSAPKMATPVIDAFNLWARHAVSICASAKQMALRLLLELSRAQVTLFQFLFQFFLIHFLFLFPF